MQDPDRTTRASTFQPSAYQAPSSNRVKASRLLPPSFKGAQQMLAAPSSSSSNTAIGKKKSKMHECEICGKIFPRPSGLKVHENIHNNLKPFPCEYEGCTQAFAVRSNARRHLRIHGVHVAVHSRSDKLPPYTVDFDTPIVLPPAPDTRSEKNKRRYKVRWTSPSLMSRKYAEDIKPPPDNISDPGDEKHLERPD